MPKQTFLNLPEARQEEFLDAAFREFALHEYKVASINTILRKLGIAKGSFYQYFENKLDLYFYLINYASRIRFDNLEELLKDESLSFPDILARNFVDKLRYDLDRPLYSGFIHAFMQERGEPEITAFRNEMKIKIIRKIEIILARYTGRKEIRQDVPVSDMAFFVFQIQWSMYEYIELKYGINFSNYIRTGKKQLSLSEKTIINDVQMFSELIFKGIIHDHRK